MSQAHKGSRLLIKDVIYAVPFNSAHFNFNEDALGIRHGDIVYPQGPRVFTQSPDGVYGGCVLIEEGANNMFSDVSQAQDWAKWSHYYNANYWNQSARGVIDDAVMGKVFYGTSGSTTSAYLYSYNVFPIVSGTTYTSSIYLKASSDYPNYTFSGYIATDTKGTRLGTVNQKGITTQWKRYTTTVSANDNFAIGGVGWAFHSLPSGCVLYAAMPQLEQNSFATTFVDGYRANGWLEYPRELFNPASFTINMWVRWSAFSSGYNPLFECNSGESNRFLWMLNTLANGNKLSVWASNPTGEVYSVTPHTPIINQWYMYTVTFDGSKYKQYVNGVLVTTFSSTVVSTPSSTTNLTIGSGLNGAANGFIDDVVILPNTVEDEEINSWYIAGTPFYNPYDYRAYAY